MQLAALAAPHAVLLKFAALFKRTEFFLAVMIFNVPSRVHDTVLKMIYILWRYIY